MRYLFYILITAGFGFAPAKAQKPAAIKEMTRMMPTYPFSDPDPVAKPESAFYPYFRFDGYSHQSEPKEWKVVEMENDYISLAIFPEIGGKIWGATEKSTGKEFIYYNHAVKFRDIAMRGAWTSGGIEFNFGIIGHVPTTATPVDYYTRSNSDGSVSCFISAIELITRTTWMVEVNLPSDKAYFTTRTTWQNTSSVEQPYYQWMNAGYKAAGNLEFCYPGQYYIGHGGDVHAFPVDEAGRLISWYEKNNFGADKSYHVLGKYNDFYGAYWHDDNFGSVHYAPYDEKLGMKIFLWGLSRQGEIWEELLTDTDGQYVELQSGRMYNQPASNSAYTPYKHYAFLPGTTDRWIEHWFPVKETGGISKVSPIGSLHAVKEDGMLKVSFSPLQKLNTTLIVRAGGQLLFEESLQTDVLETWEKEFPIKNDLPLSVEIGEEELVWYEVPEQTNLNRPDKLPSGFDWNSMYGLYVQGEQWLNQNNIRKAEEYFLLSLEKEPYFLLALNKMASLCYRTARYDKALEYIRTALSLAAYDGEANYIYGLINYDTHPVDAKDGFSVAAYSPAYRSAAYAMLAKCFLKEKNWIKALHYADRSLESNSRNQDAIMARLIALRKSADKTGALDYSVRLLDDMPLNHPVRFEKELLSDDMHDFTSLIRNELPHETYIEIAGWYVSAGLPEEALQLLSFAGEYAIAQYWMAYLYQQTGNATEATLWLDKAINSSPKQVFPFRPATLIVLEWAQTVSPSWKTDYYAALLWWHLGDKVKAGALLDNHNNVSFAPYYQSRAMLKTGTRRLDDLLKAEQLESSWRIGFALINYYLGAGDEVTALQTARRYASRFPANYMIGLKYAKALQKNGKYKECIDLLKRTQVLPNEGAYEGRAIYRESHLYQAVNQLNKKQYSHAINSIEDSKVWIENLGVGKPYEENIDNYLEDYLMAVIYEKQNKQAEATAYYQKIVDKEKGAAGRNSLSNELLTAIALQQLGKKDEADRLAAGWLKNQPDNKIAQWATAVFEGDNRKATTLLQEQYTVEDTTPWEQISGDFNFNLVSGILNRLMYNK
ncbi:MAG: DUF5107 domain-containing protein [Tannerella sp.]|jgi:tetratricopeptide (TPR) repeat protein|nr:DUF5107 domain-containing protein [Tannerella sp.]